jgi:hypothetical protein
MLLQKSKARSSHYRVSQQDTLWRLLQWGRPRSHKPFGGEPERDDNILRLFIYRVLYDTNHVSALNTKIVAYDELSLDSQIQDMLESKCSVPRELLSS